MIIFIPVLERVFIGELLIFVLGDSVDILDGHEDLTLFAFEVVSPVLVVDFFVFDTDFLVFDTDFFGFDTDFFGFATDLSISLVDFLVLFLDSLYFATNLLDFFWFSFSSSL